MKSQVVLAGLASLCVAGYAQAIDLAGVYNQALQTDPTYKVAEATWLAAKENLPLALVGTGAAGTGLFPNITATGLYTANYQHSTAAASNNRGYSDKEFVLTLVQPIFNLATWSGIRQAGFGVRSSYATYMAAGQDLINRVAVAYFEVLRANEDLQYTIKEKEADRWELITDLQKYKVGLTAVTGVYNSQSSYDQQISSEISDRSTLRDKAENLRAITNALYTAFKKLPPKLPAVIPAPASMSKWVDIALKQSYSIKSSQMAMLEAKQTILTDLAGVAPTFDAVGTYNYDNYSQGYSTAVGSGKTSVRHGYGGLSMNFPLLQGGHIWVQHSQDKANYLQASDNLALTYASTKNDTRQAYLNVAAGIAQIDADYQTIVANEKNLQATRAAYLVGTRDMSDVLDAIALLYSAKKSWAGARYDYVEALFSLKYNAGTLSPKDVAAVNSWLHGNVKMQYALQNYKKDPYYNAANIEIPVSSQKGLGSRTKHSASRAARKPAAKKAVKRKTTHKRAQASMQPAQSEESYVKGLPSPSSATTDNAFMLPQPK